MERKPLLTIRDLYFKFYRGTDFVLKGINLTFNSKEFVLLIGPSGCGKTTLINTINGLIPHTIRGIRKGEVLIEGVDVKDMELREVSTKVGTVFQDPETQFFTLTVLDELAFGPENLKMPVEEIEKRIDFAVKATGIENLLEKDISSLSGGQKQRVAIASVLTMKPKILILDEPTTNLDPRGAAEVLRTIRKLRDETDMLIILIEHRLEEVSKYADRVIVMNDGQILADGDPRKVYSNPQILYNLGIRPPWSAEVSIKLKELGLLPKDTPVAISPEEAAEQLRSLIESGKVNPDQEKFKSLNFKEEESYVKLRERDPIIEINNLWHRYPDGTVALRGISLEIHQGEFVGLVGQNGSGKTTLLLHILGLLRPSYGSVKVFGKDVVNMSVAELSQSIGLIFQNPDLMLFQNTVWSEIAFGPKNIGLNKKEIETRVRESLEMMRLVGFEKRHPRALSRGQRHRVAVASVLAMRPKILIADEPTTGQDYGASKKYLELLERLNRAGTTIILVSHSMDLVAKYARRVVVLKDGKVLLDGPTRHVYSRVDILRETHLEPPYISRIASPLYNHGIPTILTIDELFSVITNHRELIEGSEEVH